MKKSLLQKFAIFSILTVCIYSMVSDTHALTYNGSNIYSLPDLSINSTVYSPVSSTVKTSYTSITGATIFYGLQCFRMYDLPQNWYLYSFWFSPYQNEYFWVHFQTANTWTGVQLFIKMQWTDFNPFLWQWVTPYEYEFDLFNIPDAYWNTTDEFVVCLAPGMYLDDATTDVYLDYINVLLFWLEDGLVSHYIWEPPTWLEPIIRIWSYSPLTSAWSNLFYSQMTETQYNAISTENLYLEASNFSTYRTWGNNGGTINTVYPDTLTMDDFIFWTDNSWYMLPYNLFDWFSLSWETIYNDSDFNNWGGGGTGTNYFEECTSFIDVWCYIQGLWNTFYNWISSFFVSIGFTGTFDSCSVDFSTDDATFRDKLNNFLAFLNPFMPPAGATICAVWWQEELQYSRLVPEQNFFELYLPEAPEYLTISPFIVWEQTIFDIILISVMIWMILYKNHKND